MNYDPVNRELEPNTASAVVYVWPYIDVVTDAELSASGEARHKTIGGRGVVGRLIDKARK